MHMVHIIKVTGIAGAEGHLLRLLPGLSQHGIKVNTLILEDPRHPVGPFCRALQERDIQVETVPIRTHIAPLLIGRLARRLRELKPDLVHTHLLHADLYGTRAAVQAQVPHIISSRHNDDAFRYNPIINWVNRKVTENTHCVIAISDSLARFVHEVEGIELDKIVTVHYGLEAPSTSPGARQAARNVLGFTDNIPLVGVFGRLVRQKGIDVLLEAFPSVLAQHQNAQLVIVGDGPLRSGLEALAHQLNLDNVVKFAGWIDGARTLMPACDLIVVPSRWEGFGLVTLEAMGYARPIVASRTSALPEIIVDGETGLLIPPEDSLSLANAVNTLLGDPERAAAFGQAGYSRLVTVFSVDKMVHATLDIYAKVMKTS